MLVGQAFALAECVFSTVDIFREVSMIYFLFYFYS